MASVDSISEPAHPTAPSKPVVPVDRSIRVVRACTVRRSAHELYPFFRDVSRLAAVVPPAVTVSEISPTESHWKVEGPPGARHVEWHALIVTDEPDTILAWRSRDKGDLHNAGSVHFHPGPGEEGTEVRVELRYEPPRKRALAWFAKLARKEPGQLIAATLRRFKALMEAGEIPTTNGQPRGRPRAVQPTGYQP